MKIHKVVFVGAGARGGHWIKVIKKDERYEPIALVDPSKKSLEKALNDNPDIPLKTFSSVSEAAKNVKADVAIIAAPSTYRLQTCFDVINAKWHLFVEKPLAFNLRDAVAIVNNRNRPRVVPEDIMLLSHEGAATNMYDVIKGNLPRGLNGGVRVILNNRDNTIVWADPDTKKPMKTSQGDIIIKDFTYLTLKKEGKTIGPETDVKRQLLGWIAANVPKTKLTKDMMGVSDQDIMDNIYPKKT